MTDNTNDLAVVEVSMEHAKKIVEFGNNIAKLETNRAFQSVVLNGYFVDEASRLTMLLADFNIPAEAKLDVLDSLRGIAYFRRFLMNRRSLGQTAEKELLDLESCAEEIRMEGE